MKKFVLSAKVVVSAYTEVEAESLEDAIEQAADRDVVLLGSHDCREAADSWLIEDADGEPQAINGEEA